MNYGPEFQTIDNIHYNNNTILSALNSKIFEERFIVSPMLLDGALKIAGVPHVIHNGELSSFVPVSINSLEFYSKINKSCYVLHPYQEEDIKGQAKEIVSNLDKKGEVLCKIDGLIAKKTSKKSLQALLYHQMKVTNLFYHTDFVLQNSTAENGDSVEQISILLIEIDLNNSTILTSGIVNNGNIISLNNVVPSILDFQNLQEFFIKQFEGTPTPNNVAFIINEKGKPSTSPDQSALGLSLIMEILFLALLKSPPPSNLKIWIIDFMETSNKSINYTLSVPVLNGMIKSIALEYPTYPITCIHADKQCSYAEISKMLEHQVQLNEYDFELT